jgi:ABC-type multidrug transport system permease subunit
MYAVLPFGIATGLVEVPYLLMQSVIFVPIMYFAVGFRMSVEAFCLFVVIFTGKLYEFNLMYSSVPSCDTSSRCTSVVLVPRLSQFILNCFLSLP